MGVVNCEKLGRFTKSFHPDTTVEDLDQGEFWEVFGDLGKLVHVINAFSYVEYERKYLKKNGVTRDVKLTQLQEKFCSECL